MESDVACPRHAMRMMSVLDPTLMWGSDRLSLVDGVSETRYIAIVSLM